MAGQVAAKREVLNILRRRAAVAKQSLEAKRTREIAQATKEEFKPTKEQSGKLERLKKLLKKAKEVAVALEASGASPVQAGYQSLVTELWEAEQIDRFALRVSAQVRNEVEAKIREDYQKKFLQVEELMEATALHLKEATALRLFSPEVTGVERLLDEFVKKLEEIVEG